MKVNEGLIVVKTPKIHVKVELDRNPITKAIQLKTIFNPKAPNVFNEKKDFIWEPTAEEIEFLFQAFNMFPSTSQKQIYPEIKEPEEDIPSRFSSEERYEETSDDSEENQQEEEQKEEQFEEVSAKDETSSDEEPSEPKSEFDKMADSDDDFGEKEKDRVLIAADAKTIDEIVKRKRGNGEGTFKEANEETILDKILRQKKKGEL